jgi:hypothetical protein
LAQADPASQEMGELKHVGERCHQQIRFKKRKNRTIIECMDALVPHIVTGCPVYMSELVGLGGPRAGPSLRAGPALGAHNPGVLHKNKAIQLRILYRPSLYRARSASPC